jgi:hypothetical protein
VAAGISKRLLEMKAREAATDRPHRHRFGNLGFDQTVPVLAIELERRSLDFRRAQDHR